MAFLGKLIVATWPVGHVAMMAGLDASKPDPKLKAGAVPAFAGRPYYLGLLDHVVLELACIPKFVVALLVLGQLRAAIAAAASGVPIADWAVPIIIRDLVITWATAGGWDLLLHAPFSPFRSKMTPYKFNPEVCGGRRVDYVCICPVGQLSPRTSLMCRLVAFVLSRCHCSTKRCRSSSTTPSGARRRL